METPYSKLDEVIDEGVHALRGQALDTSAMASVLKPRRRSVVLPVGLATAAAVVVGMVVLMAPTKADAGEFGKVIKAVKARKAVYEKVMKPGKDQTWEVELVAWQDGEKKGVKYPPSKGGAEIVFDGKAKYVKTAKDVDFILVKDEDTKFEGTIVEEGEADIFLGMRAVDIGFADDGNTTINEILARKGMEFLGIQRNATKDGRAADVYRMRLNDESGGRLYYVDPKTDLPFLLEVFGPDGELRDRVELSFPNEISVVFLPESGKLQVLGPGQVEGEIVIIGTADTIKAGQTAPPKK